MNRVTTRPLVVLVATLAIALTTLFGPTPAAHAAPSRTDAAALAAAYVAEELKANNHRLPSFSGESGTVDWGLTIDALFGFAATGFGTTEATQVANAITTDGWQYIQWATPGQDMGAIAKLALAYQVAASDPTNVDISQMPNKAPFGGGNSVDLIALLRASVAGNGRLGTSNHFGQALGVLALARTPAGAPASTVDYLRTLQCTDSGNSNVGGFGYGGCGSVDGDGTGMALSAMLAAGVSTSDAAVTRAITWMQSTQKTDGSFAASHEPAAGNTNSTGLVVQVARQLNTTSTNTVADKGEQYLESLQITCGSAFKLGATTPATSGGFWGRWNGGIAYNADGYRAAESSGLETYETDQWRRATVQAMLGLDGAVSMKDMKLTGQTAIPTPACSLNGTAPSISGTAEVNRTVTAQAGSYTNSNTSTTGTPQLTWQWQRNGAPISGATNTTYTITTADLGTSLTVAATTTEPGFAAETRTSPGRSISQGAATFAVSAPSNYVPHGTSATITATGLAPSEPYTVKISGQQLATGNADSAGSVSATVTIPLGWWTMTRPVVVTGQSPNRTGHTTVKVAGQVTLSVSAPASPIEQGKSATVTTRGLVPGETITVRVSGQLLGRGTANSAGVATTTVTIPSGWYTLTRPVDVAGQWAQRSGKTTIRTAGTKTFAVSATKNVVGHGTATTITARGLLAGETFTVRVSGQILGRGTANSAGVATLSVRIPKGWYTLTRPVTVTSQFAKRAGATTIRTAGPKKLSVFTPSYRVKAGTRAVIKASGLTSGEVFNLYVSGQRLASGRANGSGVVTATVTIPRGWKTLTRPVVVNGQWAQRTGAAKVNTRA